MTLAKPPAKIATNPFATHSVAGFVRIQSEVSQLPLQPQVLRHNDETTCPLSTNSTNEEVPRFAPRRRTLVRSTTSRLGTGRSARTRSEVVARLLPGSTAHWTIGLFDVQIIVAAKDRIAVDLAILNLFWAQHGH